MREGGRVHLVLGLVALVGGGCATTVPRSWAQNDMCPARRVAAVEKPPADSWLSLLLEGYDPATRRATNPAVDCTGARVVWSAAAYACTDGDAARKELPLGPIAAEDVLTFPAGPGLWLTWIITGRYASGDAVGVVALAETSRGEPEKRLVVRAMGALRAYPKKVKLRLQPMGMQDLLVAEGERCADGGAPCTWAVRLEPLQGKRFVPEPVRGVKGECLEAALVNLKQQATARVGESLRKTEGETSLAFEPGGVRVEESVVVQEVGRKSDVPPRLLHRAHDTRVITVEEGQLKAPSPSLWTRMASEMGAR